MILYTVLDIPIILRRIGFFKIKTIQSLLIARPFIKNNAQRSVRIECGIFPQRNPRKETGGFRYVSATLDLKSYKRIGFKSSTGKPTTAETRTSGNITEGNLKA